MTDPYVDELAGWAARDDEPKAEMPPSVRSWRSVDLSAVLDGSFEPPLPTVGSRADGVGMFYLGRQHTLSSESEGGKTMLMLSQTATELERGNAVLYLDFEDGEDGVIGRLLALGAQREAIRQRFAYLRPEEPIHTPGNRGDLAQLLGDLRPTLAILDGVTEAMTLHGLDPLNNKDAATFGRTVPRWIAGHGPATVSLDHVTKDREGRGRYAIGAVHKLNGLNGAAYLMVNRQPFGIGVTGRSTVLIAKDRPGQLRRHALASGQGLHWYADLVVIGHDPTFAEATVEPPSAQPEAAFRPTVLMARVATALSGAPEPLTVRGVLDRVKAKRAEDTRAALAALVDEGYVVMEPGPRGAHLHRLVKPFTEEAHT